MRRYVIPVLSILIFLSDQLWSQNPICWRETPGYLQIIGDSVYTSTDSVVIRLSGQNELFPGESAFLEIMLLDSLEENESINLNYNRRSYPHNRTGIGPINGEYFGTAIRSGEIVFGSRTPFFGHPSFYYSNSVVGDTVRMEIQDTVWRAFVNDLMIYEFSGFQREHALRPNLWLKNAFFDSTYNFMTFPVYMKMFINTSEPCVALLDTILPDQSICWNNPPSGMTISNNQVFSNITNNQRTVTGINQIDAGGNGYIKMILNQDLILGDGFTFGLDPDTSITGVEPKYAWGFVDDGPFRAYYNGSSIAYLDNDSPGTPKNLNGDSFAIEKVEDTIRFFKNGHLLESILDTTVGQALYPVLSLDDNSIAPKTYDLSLSMSHGCYALQQNGFNTISSAIRSQYAKVADDELRVVFNQRYNVVPGQNDTADYNIYDWQRQSVGNGTIPVVYGPNHHTLDISSAPLLDGAYYVLEVTGPNKGETYYLRFKYN